jgi:MarR family transcriptional regulator for hemolysin
MMHRFRDDPPLEPDLQFASELFRVSRRWGLHVDERLRAVGPGRAVWATLMWLSRRGQGASQRELAESMGVETPTMTRQLEQMERLGLIERQTVRGDRRAKRVELTDRGRDTLERMDALAAQVRSELLREVDPADLDVAVKVLMAIRRRM